jgi:hypothetical protein
MMNCKSIDSGMADGCGGEPDARIDAFGHNDNLILSIFIWVLNIHLAHE